MEIFFYMYIYVIKKRGSQSDHNKRLSLYLSH